MSTGVSRALDSKTDQVFFNFNRSHGAYALGLSTRYSTGGVIQADLTFNISLGREPYSGTWIPEYRPIASQGSLSVQAFVDKNLNGSKDSDEQAVPTIKVQVNGGKVPQKPQDSGVVFITGLEPYRELDVDLAVESLEDPLWHPAIIGKRISLRPGHTAKIDFPIIITGEIDGTAYFSIGQNKQGVSGVVIELVDLNNNIVKTAKTEYDGFYLLDKIPAGKYELRVSREQTDKLGLLPVQPTFVVVETDNPIVNGLDFVLQKRGE